MLISNISTAYLKWQCVISAALESPNRIMTVFKRVSPVWNWSWLFSYFQSLMSTVSSLGLGAKTNCLHVFLFVRLNISFPHLTRNNYKRNCNTEKDVTCLHSASPKLIKLVIMWTLDSSTRTDCFYYRLACVQQVRSPCLCILFDPASFWKTCAGKQNQCLIRIREQMCFVGVRYKKRLGSCENMKISSQEVFIWKRRWRSGSFWGDRK